MHANLRGITHPCPYCEMDGKNPTAEQYKEHINSHFPMTTKTIIQNMEKDFRNTKFAKGGGLCFECCDYEGMWDDLETFIRSYTRSLLSAFAEEVVGENEYRKPFDLYQSVRNDAKQEQRLKAKEIISLLEEK